ncbi:hypothetical protein ACCC96_12505 [Pseudomonas sp. Pseusp11]|uniref:hypothetical protein n=1 Tax=Pseudomonas sp. Pseusp11 TaxID=3243003 RepID=UPI0039B5E699
MPIGTDWVTQLKTLLIEHAGVVVWVNSAYLVDYAPVYGSDPGYMHAVLVIGMNDTSTHVKIFDSLIVDREPYGCEAWLSLEAFASAHTDRVRTETYDQARVSAARLPAWRRAKESPLPSSVEN